MSIYEPAEDSYLMSQTLKEELPKLLKRNPILKLLEVGCGSGINLQAARESGVKEENIMGADINAEAVKHCKALGFKAIKSNLFSGVVGKFDVIVFNPPYLPEDKREPKSSRRETTGGKRGSEMIIDFLRQARNHLTKEGRVFLITSSLSEEVNFPGLGYKARPIAKKKLFFESLFVWMLNEVE